MRDSEQILGVSCLYKVKNIVIISFGLLLSTSLYAQVRFFDGTFEEAKEVASVQGKGLFIDFYADWCVPCKQMEKYGFSDEKFSKSINEFFIAVKVDVDMFVGMDVAELYEVDKYPTVIITDAKALEVDRREGYQSSDQLNKFVEGLR